MKIGKVMFIIINIDNMTLLRIPVESTHRYAGCAVQRGAIEDGGWADNQAEHDQTVDHKVLQGVPPES